MIWITTTMVPITSTILPCLTKPFIPLLLLGYLCTIYTQNKHYCSNKIAVSLQKFINLGRPTSPSYGWAVSPWLEQLFIQSIFTAEGYFKILKSAPIINRNDANIAGSLMTLKTSPAGQRPEEKQTQRFCFLTHDIFYWKKQDWKWLSSGWWEGDSESDAHCVPFGGQLSLIWW